MEEEEEKVLRMNGREKEEEVEFKGRVWSVKRRKRNRRKGRGIQGRVLKEK